MKKLKSQFSEVLADCLDMLEGGEKSIQDCLSQYPEYAHQLEPLLLLSTRLKQAQGVNASRSFQQDAIIRFKKQAEHQKTENQLTGWPVEDRVSTKKNQNIHRTAEKSENARKLPIVNLFSSRLAWALAVLIMVCSLFIVSGAAYASSHAYPGMLLYPVKRNLEKVQVQFTNSPIQAQQYHLIFAARRLDEVNYLLSMNQSSQIEPLVNSYREHVSEAAKVINTPGLSDQDKIILSDYLNNNLAVDESMLGFIQRITGEDLRELIQPALEAAHDARVTAQAVIRSLPEIRTQIQENLLGTVVANIPSGSGETSLTPPVRVTETPTPTLLQSDYTPFPLQTYAVTYVPPLWATITPDWNWLATRYPSLYPTLSSLATQYPDLTLTPRPLLRPTRIRPSEIPPIRELPRQP